MKAWTVLLVLKHIYCLWYYQKGEIRSSDTGIVVWEDVQ